MAAVWRDTELVPKWDPFGIPQGIPGLLEFRAVGGMLLVSSALVVLYSLGIFTFLLHGCKYQYLTAVFAVGSL